MKGMWPSSCWNAREFMQRTGQPFEVALAVMRAGNLSPPTRLWLRVLTVSLGPHRTISWWVRPGAAWHHVHIWRSTGAERSMA